MRRTRAVDRTSQRVARRRLIATGDYIRAVIPDEIWAALQLLAGWPDSVGVHHEGDAAVAR
jgi:hypothetical protein